MYSLQTIYGASDEYTYTSLVVVSPDQAFEQFSSRLRSLVVVLLGGSVLLFGAVSVARALDRTSAKKRETVDAAGGTGFGAGNLTDSELPLDLGGRIDISTARRTSGLMVKVGRGAEDRSPLANRSTASGEVEGE